MVGTLVLVMVGVGSSLLVAAAVLAVVRTSRGPSSLDRVVAADVLIAVVVAALALEAIVHDHTTTLPVMLVLSLVGFAGSVSIARFVADRDKAARWNVERGNVERGNVEVAEHHVDSPRPQPEQDVS